ncbi:MAG TPA: dihydrodipicolinate synthase family protein, partial [Holophagaceae bacterium]|nr:dihydrodipicolinate synthase family protein [Holophagaceae bacterium]
AAPGLPLVLYNVPGRTGLNLTPPMLAKLWENPALVAVKESSGNLAQIGEIARTLPPGKTLLSGDDGLGLPALALGASGLVSVLANLVPGETKAMVDAARRGDFGRARTLHQRLLPLMDALFLESNPGPLKAGLKRLGLAEDVLRLPLVAAESGTRAKLLAALEALQ